MLCIFINWITTDHTRNNIAYSFQQETANERKILVSYIIWILSFPLLLPNKMQMPVKFAYTFSKKTVEKKYTLHSLLWGFEFKTVLAHFA